MMKNRSVKYFPVPIIVFLFFVVFVSVLITFPPQDERFSEIWVLDEDYSIDNFPSEIGVGEDYLVYVFVSNQMNSAKDYKILLKINNQTDQFSDVESWDFSLLPSFYEFEIYVEDETVRELPFRTAL